MKKLFCSVFFVSLLIGCASEPDLIYTSSPVNNDTNGELNSTLEVSSPAHGFDSCEPEIINISEERIYGWFWSTDSKVLYFTNDSEFKDWIALEIDSGDKSFESDISLPPVFKIPESLSDILPSNLFNEWKTFPITVSPDGNSLIYSLPVFTRPTPTPAPGLVSDKDYEYISDIYLVTKETSKETYIGRVEGYIMEYEWSLIGDKVLMEIDPHLTHDDTYLWLLDLNNRSLIPIVNLDNVKEWSEWTSISPNGQLIVYRSDEDATLGSINLNTMERSTLKNKPNFIFQWWLDDENWLILQPARDNRSYQISKYDLGTGGVNKLAVFEIDPYLYKPFDPILSPDQMKITFVSKNTFQLYLITLC